MLVQMQQSERQWIEALQHYVKNPLLDLFFQGWNLVDSFGFMALLITCVWYMIDKKLGIKLFYIIILSVTVNTSLKHIFTLPRPCHIDPSLGLLCPPSYGLPSGAAQSAILLGSILFLESKKIWMKVTAVIFAMLLCFSRVYLGVHYISDVLVGIVIGALLAVVYYKIFPIFEKKWKKMVLLFPLLIFFIGGPYALLFVSFTVGMQLGLIAEGKKNQPKDSTAACYVKTCIIVIGLFTLSAFAMQADALKLIFGLVMGAWLSYLGPKTCALLFRKV